MKALHLLWAVPFPCLLALHLIDRGRQESELAELQGKLAALSTSARTLRTELAARRQMPQPAAASAAPRIAEQPAPAEDPSHAGPPPLDVIETRDQLEASFLRQHGDVRWSGEAQRTAATRLSAILPETSKLQSLECRASMCRIETAHQGLESYQLFVRNAFMNPETKLWNGGFFTMQLDDPVNGKLVTVSYLARDGEELAIVAEPQR
jgi:hypothetical protein